MIWYMSISGTGYSHKTEMLKTYMIALVLSRERWQYPPMPKIVHVLLGFYLVMLHPNYLIETITHADTLFPHLKKTRHIKSKPKAIL